MSLRWPAGMLAALALVAAGCSASSASSTTAARSPAAALASLQAGRGAADDSRLVRKFRQALNELGPVCRENAAKTASEVVAAHGLLSHGGHAMPELSVVQDLVTIGAGIPPSARPTDCAALLAGFVTLVESGKTLPTRSSGLPPGSPTRADVQTWCAKNEADIPDCGTPEDPVPRQIGNWLGYRSCAASLSATSTASCAFAQNIFYAAATSYNDDSWAASQLLAASVYSPATERTYPVDCVATPGGNSISCVNQNDPTAAVAFPLSAVRDYTQSQASAYASSHDLGDTTAHGSPPDANATGTTTDTTVEGPGSYSHAGDAAFCSDHQCIANFPNGSGYVVQCVDGQWSHSGGLSGACSDHGGET